MQPIEHLSEIAGRCSIHPKWWPILSWYGYTQEQIEDIQLKQNLMEIQSVKFLAERYRVAEWISVCQYSNITLADWIGLGDDNFTKLYGLPYLVQKAIAYEVDKLAREIQRKRTEQEQQIKLETMNLSNSTQFKNNDSLKRIFG